MMGNKSLLFGILAVLISGIAVVGWQYGQSQTVSLKACGGDFAYETTCPLGTYCKKLGKAPTSGGICTSYLSPFFKLLESSSQTPEQDTNEPATVEVYRSETWGFSFELPLSLKIQRQETSELVRIELFDELDSVGVAVFAGKENAKGIQERITPADTNDKVEQTKEVINGISWNVMSQTEFPPHPGRILSYYTTRKNITYLAECYQCDEEIFGEPGRKEVKLLHEIVSRIEFAK